MKQFQWFEAESLRYVEVKDMKNCSFRFTVGRTRKYCFPPMKSRSKWGVFLSNLMWEGLYSFRILNTHVFIHNQREWLSLNYDIALWDPTCSVLLESYQTLDFIYRYNGPGRKLIETTCFASLSSRKFRNQSEKERVPEYSLDRPLMLLNMGFHSPIYFNFLFFGSTWVRPRRRLYCCHQGVSTMVYFQADFSPLGSYAHRDSYPSYLHSLGFNTTWYDLRKAFEGWLWSKRSKQPPIEIDSRKSLIFHCFSEISFKLVESVRNLSGISKTLLLKIADKDFQITILPKKQHH